MAFELAQQLYTDFASRSHSLSSKAVFIIVACFMAWAVDNHLGFSYFYSTQNKIEQTKELSALISDSTIDSETKASLRHLRRKVIQRQGIIAGIRDYMRNRADVKPDTVYVRVQTDGVRHTKRVISRPRNPGWHIISSSGVVLLMGIVVVVILLFDKDQSLSQKMGTSIAALTVFSIVVALLTWVFGLIPQIGVGWGQNYALNTLLQTILIGLLAYVADKNSKT